MTCTYQHKETGEQRQQISVLDPDEVGTVERVRKVDGEAAAHVVAAAIVLKSAYSELDPLEWDHLSVPEFISVN
ncbi:hypothetical protein [Bradyrhizobium sp. SZCCHNS3053]|uniref:hypothetical protein n=1 Tax=Bradyrhizobium sp. SZCCHNS3053 TaxID=3057322 RepID=UPI002916884A|nr:hypothetical protein [Bradyrhizobium sp. SZCCHNS3053]